MTPVRTFLSFARETASFYFAFPIMRLLGPLLPSSPSLPPRRSDPFFSEPTFALVGPPLPLLARRLFVPLLLPLHSFPPPFLSLSFDLASINLFFSLWSSGPRNEQRKSIGWHCGFVPSTVVLDPHVERTRESRRSWASCFCTSSLGRL